MVRTTHIRRQFDDEGSDRAVQLGAALGAIAGEELVENLLHAVSTLDSLGGQFFIAAERPKFAQTEKGMTELEDHRQPGKYMTVGYVFHYNHIATALRAPKEPDETPDQAMNGEVPEELAIGDEIEA